MPASSPSSQISSVLFANLPLASSVSGLDYFVTDIGTNGTFFRSNGTLWRPWNGYALLAATAAPASVTGTVTETVLATYTVPANLLTPNGLLKISPAWGPTNNANNKTVRIKYDGNSFSTIVAANVAAMRQLTFIENRNATNSQIGGLGGTSTTGAGNSTTVMLTTAIDTTLAKNITLTAQLTNIADTMTLEEYTIELFIP